MPHSSLRNTRKILRECLDYIEYAEQALGSLHATQTHIRICVQLEQLKNLVAFALENADKKQL